MPRSESLRSFVTLTFQGADRGKARQMAALDRAAFGPAALDVDEILAVAARPDGYGLIVLDDRATVAACSLYAARGGNVEVQRLAVAPDFRRRGLGTMILDRHKRSLQQRGRRLNWVGLWCRSDNYDARAFYQRLRFREIKEDPDRYGRRDPGVRLIWRPEHDEELSLTGD